MASRRRQEGGKKQHAEGQHGDLTHEAIQQQLKHKLTEKNATPKGNQARGGEKGGNGGESNSTSGENK